MATVGLYDIDFNHGSIFNLNMPLMKAYSRLLKEGHHVIMMKPFEKTGRYNNILYFKDNPSMILPRGVVVDYDKSKFYGYGFLKESGLSETTKTFAPSFLPYEMNQDRVKNKELFNSIRRNSLIDWREKDITGYRKGTAKTYINDRDFLDESDWKDVFKEFDNDIVFTRTIKPKDYSTAIEFLEMNPCDTRVVLKDTCSKEQYLELLNYKNISYDFDSEEDLVLFIFAAKVLSDEKIKICNKHQEGFIRELSKWAAAGGQQSFSEWQGSNFNPSLYIKFKYRLLLKQDPKKITYENFKANWLT